MVNHQTLRSMISVAMNEEAFCHAAVGVFTLMGSGTIMTNTYFLSSEHSREESGSLA